MNTSLQLIVILSLFGFGQLESRCDLTSFASDPTLVQTKNGPIQGICNQVFIGDPINPNRFENVISWFGIPFAEPPVGKNRFMPPVAVQSWKEVRNTTKKTASCMQNKSPSWDPMSEDCLHLNVYAPLKPSTSRPLPIYFYIHGGTFLTNSPYEFDPSIVVGLSDIIVVTINYRLGAFGFMYLPESGIQGNMGFLDQHLALKWVFENAHHFNGDPSQITIGGTSAGAFSLGYHMVYPPSWPYFSGIFMESGSIFMSKMEFISKNETSRRTSEVFNLFGCSKSMNKSEFLQCAQNHGRIGSEDLIEKNDKYYNENILLSNPLAYYMSPMYHLVQNDIDFNQSIKNYFATGHFKRNLAVLVGNSKNEGGFYLHKFQWEANVNWTRFNYFLDNFYFFFPTYPTRLPSEFKQSLISVYTTPGQTDFTQSLTRILGEHVYICPSVDFVSFYSSRDMFSKIFRYVHEYRSTGSDARPEFGVIHAEEEKTNSSFTDFLKVWFGEALSPEKNYTNDEKILSKQVIKYWTNFVKYGNPNYYAENEERNPVWPQWIERDWIQQPELDNILNYESYLLIDINNLRSTNDSSSLKCDFWRKYSNYPL